MTVAPEPWQGEAHVLVDHVDHRRLELAAVMCCALIRRSDSRRRKLGGMAGSLVRTKIAAIAEHGEDVSLDCLRQFRIGPGGWSEMARVVGPVLDMS